MLNRAFSFFLFIPSSASPSLFDDRWFHFWKRGEGLTKEQSTLDERFIQKIHTDFTYAAEYIVRVRINGTHA